MDHVITENNIDAVLASSKVVVVDFWAPWCGPCRVLGPTMDEVAADYEGKAIVAKCNVDDCEDIAAKFGIRNIPTLIFFKDSAPVDRTSGIVSKQDIESRIDALL
ncbi:MAG: thioredoxin [Bacteroidales bacterium]|nr:thioredoxin [Bacteroidales bacterium]